MALKKPQAPKEDPQQYVLKKNFKKAIELYRAQSSDAPEDANLALRLADVLVLDAQIPAAVREYKRAAKLFGDQGFLLKAIGVNKKIVKLDPSQAEVHENLSKLYEEKGLLATPSSGTFKAASASGSFQFDMEESSGQGFEMDIGGTGAAASAAPSGPAPAFEPEPEADLAPDALAGLESEPAPAPAGFSFGLPEAAPPADVSVDALGDALSDQSFDASEGMLDSLGADLAPDGDADRSGAALQHEKVPLFSDLTPAEFVELVTRMTQESFHKDDVIVREGDPGDSLYVVVTGSVRVSTTAKGHELKLADLGEGDFFGEGSLITGKPRTATVFASTDSELLRLSKTALDDIVARHPRVKQVMREFYQQRAESTVKSILSSRKK